MRDYDSSVTRRSEIIDYSTSRPSSCSLSESTTDNDNEELMTIRSYRDSLKQRRSSHGHATLPVPSIQLMTTTDSVLFFPLESDEEKRIRIVIQARLCFDSLERWITFN